MCTQHYQTPIGRCVRNMGYRFSKSGYRRGCVLLLLLLVLPLDPARGLSARKHVTQYVQTLLTDKAGLPQSSVNDIAQTADGYVWFATEEGLARYDGQHTAVYDTLHYPGLPDNFIVSLAPGRDDSLWIGTRRGALTRLKGGVFETFASMHCRIAAIHEDLYGRLWVATTQGLYMLHDGRTRLYTKADGLPSDAVSEIAETSNGTLWLATKRGLARYTPYGRKNIFTLQEELGTDSIEALTVGQDKSLWIATAKGITHWRDGVLAQWPASALPKDAEVSSLWQDQDGTLWVTFTHKGIARLLDGHFEIYGAQQGLPGDDVTAIYEDRNGDMFIGMSEAGVVELRDGLFTNFAQPEGLSENMVWSVLAARDNSTWVGTASKGLNHILPDGRVRTYTEKDGLHPGSIFSLYEDRDGSILMGFEDGTLGRLKDGHYSPVLVGRNENATLMCILRDHNGDLLLGYHKESGLLRIHEDRGVLKAERISHPGLLNTLLVGNDGSYWIGTDHAGLLHVQDGRTTSYNSQDGRSSDFVHAVYEDREGTIWAGTSMSGLERIKDGRVTTFSVAQGMFDQTVGAILEDDQGNLWMTCNKGIFRVSKKELNDYADVKIARVHSVSYGAAEGMRNAECNFAGLPTASKDSKGRLEFATIAGVATIDEHWTERQTGQPQMLIEQVQVDALNASPEDGQMTVGPTAGNLTINFTAPNFVAPERMHFRYRLKEFDRDWTDAGIRRQAFYTKLPPGVYEFEVQGADGDGPWSVKSAHLTLTLKPHYWQTLWFRALFSFLSLLIGVAAYHLRVRYLVSKNRLLEERVEDRTRELTAAIRASELAHEALQEQATKDSLTKLWNRRCIFEILDRESLAAARRGASICVLMADIDHFKSINDKFGHQAGDRVLMEVAQRIVRMTRASDFAGRYGGEEFLIILPGCSLADGLARAEEFRQAIYDTPVSLGASAGEMGLRVSCSFGIAACAAQPVTERLIHEADQALYSAKRAGRNRVYVGETLPSGRISHANESLLMH